MTEHNRTLPSELDRARPDGLESASGTEAQGRLGILIPLSLALGLLCLQSALFLAFAASRLDMPVYLCFHLGLCAVTATLGIWRARAASAIADANDKTVLVLQLVAWTALAGPFGTMIGAALVVPRSAAASHAEVTTETSNAADQGFEVARLELLHDSLLDRRLRLEHAHPIRPLLDVMIDGTQVEKLDALSLISKRYAPALAPTLKRALGDKDASVRVLAATVMARQHNAYTKRIGAVQTIARAAPEDSNHWSELGQAHLDYAVSGLLETSRAETETTQALAHLARAKQLDRGHAETKARLDAVGRDVASRGQPTDGAHDLPNDHEYRVTPHGY